MATQLAGNGTAALSSAWLTPLCLLYTRETEFIKNKVMHMQ